MKNLIGRKCAITKIHDGLGYEKNDIKYYKKAYNQVVTLLYLIPNTQYFYITDFFLPEYIEENNDYIHYGFLIVSDGNITLLEE